MKSTLNFCTLFDSNYFPLGITMYESLKKHESDFKLHILCLDEKVYDLLSDYPDVVRIRLDDFENYWVELKPIKSKRSRVSYIFTLSPFLPLYIITKYNDISSITSLDADLYFTSTPRPIYNYLNSFSILVTPHKFASNLIDKNLIKYGKYNVSFQVFKNDDAGIKCLNQWKSDCINWCEDIFDELNDRLADQKYLEKWDTLFSEKIYSLTDFDCGLAVWNISDYDLKYSNNKYMINEKPMIFYHFESFRIKNKYFALNGFHNFRVDLSKKTALKKLYSEYFQKLKHVNSRSNLYLTTDNRYKSSKKNILSVLITQRTFCLTIFDKIIFINLDSILKIFK